MKNAKVPILGFVASSGTGKTTLLCKLIPILQKSGLRLGIIKHSHHNFAIDKPGKDSHRFRQAGAGTVLLSSSKCRAIITCIASHNHPSLDLQLQALDQSELDLILVEGFKRESFPKIELHRSALQQPFFYPSDPNIIALACDIAPNHAKLPVKILDLNSAPAIARFILDDFLGTTVDDCVASTPDLSVAQALAKITASITPVAQSEKVTLKHAMGRTLARSVRSPIAAPAAVNSAMDGYSFASESIVPGQEFTCKLVGTSWAGKPYHVPLHKNECVRIFTGGVIPEGCDSVIMQEQVLACCDNITFPATTVARQYVRKIGEDVEEGSVVISRGKKITGIDIGLLASVGVYSISVTRKLRVAFLSTGDELVGVGNALATGQIYDSNRYLLHGLLDCPAHCLADLGVVRDDMAAIKDTLLNAAENYDVLITSGGASVGDADYMHEICREIGEVDFWEIAIKPGKPLGFGKIGNCYFFALPGNPASVMVTFHKIVAPALRLLAGTACRLPLQLSATATCNLHKSPGRQEYQRGILSIDSTGLYSVTSAGKQSSNILSSASLANCYIVLPPLCRGIAAGQQVLVEPFLDS